MKKDDISEKLELKTAPQTEVSISSIYMQLQALAKVKRPESDNGWHEITLPQSIARKSGTVLVFVMHDR